MSLSTEDLRTLGESIGRGIVREATRGIEPKALIQSVLGIDRDYPGVTIEKWIAHAVKVVRNG